MELEDNTIEHLKEWFVTKKHGYAHFKGKLRYHIIFSTKYRKKCLNDIKEQVFDAFRYCESRSDFNILNMNIDLDHIHLYIEIPPTLTVGSVVNRMKAITTNYLWSRYENYLRMFYWKKNKRLLWTHGYFASTIGDVSESTVWKYIDNQGKNKIQ